MKDSLKYEIGILKRRIDQRLKKLSYELADRAEQVGFAKNPKCSFEHQASAANMVRALDVEALNRLNGIKRLHEELFNAELKLEIANREES